MKRRGLVLSAVLAGALMTTACAAQTGTGTAAAGDAQQKVVNVTASETVTAEPDIAEFEMTVYSQATDAKTCQTQNSTDLEKAVEALKSQGIAETSIQTASFGLNPIYDWEAGKTITGYLEEYWVEKKPFPGPERTIFHGSDCRYDRIQQSQPFCGCVSEAVCMQSRRIQFYRR